MSRRRGRARARKLGRPAAERVGWEPDTFAMIQRSTLSSMGDIARLTGISEHVLYSWQGTASNRGPNAQQRAVVAKVLSELTGTNIKPTDLARKVDRVRFSFL